MRKIHLPSRIDRSKTACGRNWADVLMADEPDKDHATCWRCYDDWHFADVNGESFYTLDTLNSVAGMLK